MGYKDLVPSDRGLSINFNADDIGAFTLSDITDYFQLIRDQIPTLPALTEEEAQKILDVTRGIPLAVKIAVGLYVETAESDIFTGKNDGKREIVDVMVRRYLQHTQSSESEKAIYQRDVNQVADAIGAFFQDTNGEHSSLQWWKWAHESLLFTTSRNPSEKEVKKLCPVCKTSLH